jgi:hypothetical protein
MVPFPNAHYRLRAGMEIAMRPDVNPLQLKFMLADYSARIALSGLTRAARIAGMAHASSAATSISTMTDA